MNDDTIELPIDGTLDLHAFRPEDTADLVTDYIAACLERGIRSVRIIHGKGKGTLRRTVHATLARMPAVAYYRLAGEDAGGWGATLVELREPDRQASDRRPVVPNQTEKAGSHE